MHREISHTDEAFTEESNWPLYLMTGLLAALLALDLLPRLGDWLGWTAFQSWPRDLGTVWGIKITFGTLAAILGGARIVYIALQGIIVEGKIGADVAIAIAFLAALAIQEWLVAAEVVFIGMFGECLEAYTFDRTKRAIRKIVEVFPIRCWLLKDGQETRVFTKDVQVGDRVLVKPGAKIPVDGIVIDGRASVNASALTGESLPIEKGPGDEVLAGSITEFGALTIEAKRVAQQTVAGRVIELTAKALKDKSHLERTADRLARFFLPIVLGIALMTFLGCMAIHSSGFFRPAGAPRLDLRQALTRSVYPTLSVLVVACPCALILATPAAVIAALGRLAGTGVLIKSGAALERLAKVRAFAFDKTGTITEAKLELGDLVCLTEISADELVRLAASAEARSEHPLARLIVQEAAKRHCPLEDVWQDFTAHPGAGVTARTAVGKILIGTRRLLEEQGIAIHDAADQALARLDAAGQTALLIAHNGALIGVLGARDRLRPDAVGLLNQLRELGINPIVLLTGDRTAAAKSITQDLGFSDILAELLPEQKAQYIADLKAKKAVAMVGDGVNDAPALARADVGIAVGGASGTDIAAEAGDIVLMGDPLKALPMLIRLSRQTVHIIQQNIIWFAFVVNAVGIVVTAWLWPLFAPEGWYEQSPIAAVIYHQFGSLLVLLNSMRLLWFERGDTSPTWSAWRERGKNFDRWISTHLDLGEAAHWCEHHWKGIAAAAVLLLVTGYAASGLTIIAPDEVGVVRRFGRPIDDDLTPGWYWRYPPPIEQTTRVSKQVRTVSVGFRESLEKDKNTGALTWTSAHRQGTRNDKEALMMTGDGNLIDLLVTVRYRVTDPRVFLFEVNNAEEILRGITESELRAMVAGRPFLGLLTYERGQFQEKVLERVRGRCSTSGDGRLGVVIDGIAIVDLHPPKDVVEAYYDVAKAMEERDQRINLAKEQATKKLEAAEADVVKIVYGAKAAKAEKVLEAHKDQQRFLALHRPRQELSHAAELQLAMRAASDLFAGDDGRNGRSNAIARIGPRLLALQAGLVDYRHYWNSATKALSGRELLLIDSDKVSGRRNLMLFDPDVFRVPFPVFVPQNAPLRDPRSCRRGRKTKNVDRSPFSVRVAAPQYWRFTAGAKRQAVKN